MGRGIDGNDGDDFVGLKADAGTSVPAAIFGVAPLTGPFWKVASIEMQANFAQRLPDTTRVTLGASGGGPIDEKTAEEKQQRKDEDAVAYAHLILEETERQREREEWRTMTSSIGGVSMTGAEWGKLAERLRSDDELRRRIIEAFERRGMSREEAEKRYERVADISEIMAIPPSQRTEQQVERMEKAKADSTFETDMKQADEMSRKHASFGMTTERAPSAEASTSRPAEPTCNVEFTSGPGF